MGSGGGGQNQTDGAVNLMWIILSVCGIIVFLWYFHRSYLVSPILLVRKFELDLIQFFVDALRGVANFLNIPLISNAMLVKYKQIIDSIDPSKISKADFDDVNVVVAGWIRYFYAAFLFVLSIIVYFKHKEVNYKTKYSMDSLRKSEQVHWPQITPVVNIDLVKADANVGPWAMSKTPMMLCRENDLIFPTMLDQYEVWGLKRGPAFRIFSLQLGRLYAGADHLPIHVKALVVIFVSRAERDRDTSIKFIKQISASAVSGKLDFSGIEEALQKYKHSKAIQWVEQRHAYIYTFMATLLEVSRADGVLASSEFLWLKPVDRRLWYMLNTVGRQTAVIEISGAVSHWLAEKAIKSPLRTPMVKSAVNALEEALTGILRTKEGETWHSRGV